MFFHLLHGQLHRLYDFDVRFPDINQLGEHVRRALRMALLLDTEPLSIPTSDLVQSPVALHLMPDLQALASLGAVTFIGSATSVEELVAYESKHYSDTSLQDLWETTQRRSLAVVGGALQRRNKNTTIDVASRWREAIEVRPSSPSDAIFVRGLLHQAWQFLVEQPNPSTFESSLALIPARLEGRAFLWRVVEELGLVDLKTSPQAAKTFELLLGWTWAMSHVAEVGPPLIRDSTAFGIVDCGLATTHRHLTISLRAYEDVLRMAGLYEGVQRLRAQDLVSLEDGLVRLELHAALQAAVASLTGGQASLALAVRLRALSARKSGPLTSRRATVDHIHRFAEEVAGLTGARTAAAGRDTTRADFRIQVGIGEAPMIGKPTIFIGHGRSLLWMQLKDFLSERLQLNWTEFNRQPSAGIATVSRLEALLDESDFALLVMTAEDEAADGQLHARENVVHEVGLFQGRLGFDRAIILLEEGCTEFSNIAGLGQVRFPKGNILACSEELRRIFESRLPPQTQP